MQKKNFLALLKIAQKFHYFCKVRACRIFRFKNSILQKLPKFGETLLLMRGTNNLQKKYFLSTIEDSTKISLFL